MILEYHFAALLYDEQEKKREMRAVRRPHPRAQGCVSCGWTMDMWGLPEKGRNGSHRKYPMQHAQGGCGEITGKGKTE